MKTVDELFEPKVAKSAPFDDHDAGMVDVRPGQGIASPWGASEHDTAESHGGRGRG